MIFFMNLSHCLRQNNRLITLETWCCHVENVALPTSDSVLKSVCISEHNYVFDFFYYPLNETIHFGRRAPCDWSDWVLQIIKARSFLLETELRWGCKNSWYNPAAPDTQFIQNFNHCSCSLWTSSKFQGSKKYVWKMNDSLLISPSNDTIFRLPLRGLQAARRITNHKANISPNHHNRQIKASPRVCAFATVNVK